MLEINNLEKNNILDFLNYKNKNELIYCTFQNQKHTKIEKTIFWTTTKKYNKSLNNYLDIDTIIKDLLSLISEKKAFGSISKITCSENCHIVEFTIYP